MRYSRCFYSGSVGGIQKTDGEAMAMDSTRTKRRRMKPKTQISVRFTPETLRALGQTARKNKCRRADVIRQCVEWVLRYGFDHHFEKGGKP